MTASEVNQLVQFPYKETDDVEVTAQLAIDYYSALHLAGHRVVITWNGGGDSGSVDIMINGLTLEIEVWDHSKMTLYDKIHSYVISEVYDALDYGSFAGEYSCSGEADFKIEDGFIGFSGTDWYSEDDHNVAEWDAHLVIPAAFIPEEAGIVSINFTDGYDGSDPFSSIYFRKTGDWKRLTLSEEAQTFFEAEEKRLCILAGVRLNELNADHMYSDFDTEIPSGHTGDVHIHMTKIDYYTRSETDKLVEINLLHDVE